MIQIIRKSFYSHGYLLIIAAWLYTLSFIFSNYTSYITSPARVQDQLNSFVAKSELKFETAINDSDFLLNILNKKNFPDNSHHSEGELGLYIYTPDSTGKLALVHWSNNKMLPDAKELLQPDGSYASIRPNGNFEFIKKSFMIHGVQVVACGIIPVYWAYGINNKYLQSRFPVSNIERRYTITPFNTGLYVKNGDGKMLFNLQEKSNPIYAGWLTITLKILSVIFLLIYLNLLAQDIAIFAGWAKGFLFLLSFLFVLRYLSYVLPFPFRFRMLSLFDPTIYASNFLHPTLGDLLINTILVYWLVSFVKSFFIQAFKNAKPITGNRAKIVTVIASALLIVIAFTSSGIISSLIKDSQISFDVTNFFSLNIFSFLSFIILCFVTLSFFHLSHILLFYLYKAIGIPIYVRYIIVAVFAMVYLSFMIQNTATTGNILVLGWLLIYMAIMEFRQKDIFIPMLRSTFFIAWIMFFAVSISALIIFQNGIVNEQKRSREAEKLATEADKNAQYIFSTGIADIDSSFLSQNIDKLKNPAINKIIKDSLSSRYLSVNADAYDTHIYTFDERQMPLYNDDSLSVFYLRTLIDRGHETVAPDLYYYEKDINVFSFIYQKEMYGSDGNIKGYFFIVGDPKKFKNQTVYPELFMPGNADEADKTATYAIYNKGRLVESSGDYNFLSFMPLNEYPKGLPQHISVDDKSEFRYNAGNGKLIVTVYSQSVFLELITLFAYLFGAFLLIIALFQTGRLLVVFKFHLKKMRRGLVFNIKNQIQAAIIFISIFSFFIIGISTITFYINRFKQTNRERLIKSMKILSSEVEDNINTRHLFSPNALVYGSDSNRLLQKVIKDIAELHSADANFYDLSGNLLATTQPEIYKKQILSRMMEPKAFYRLAQQKEIQLTQDEKVSSFSFLSIYEPVYNQQGQPYAYLNVPYLNTQKELNQEISNFLVTLINLNAFIFLIAGAISVFLTNRITSSFSLIANKMKKVNLGTANEQIEWNSNDEIGALVNEYNKMVKKLEDSAVALAKSEREGAWREMAKQVAHEIKNPLTPMKLSIQYLQKAIQQNEPNMVELSKKVSATLVEQIDQLAKIASDFSQFANITKIETEMFNVTDLVRSLIDLYSSTERLQVTYNPAHTAAFINADRSQVNRLFTNLFQNAIEASEHRDTVLINIDQEISDNQLLIHFADNGSGIPIEKLDKIFTPNFTTKSSGTGLGLAISKGIVENANGKIWFDTEEGKGTTFHILLPLTENETANHN